LLLLALMTPLYTLAGPVGSSAWEMPTFRLKALDGTAHQLDEWRGKVIMLNFWASWCPPCQYEIRDFVGYQEKYGGRGLQIVGIGIDSERKLRNVARTLGINYPTLVAGEDEGWKVLKQWGDRRGVLPYTVLIARDGRLVYTHLGPLDQATFEEQVLPLF
jgi:peroxiredoxin